METEYQKGYRTAESTYKKRITELKHQHNEEMAHVSIEKVYPYNLLQDIIEEHEGTVATWLFSPKLVKEVLVKNLSERENKVLELMYGYGYTLEECGKEFGVTRERIRQMQAKAIRKLRNPKYLKEMRVVPFSEYIQNIETLQKAKDRIEQLTAKLNEISGTNLSAEEIKIGDTPLEKLDLSVRSYNCLKRAGINTVDDIVKIIQENRLESVRNLGKRSIAEIKEKLNSLGVKTC